MKLAAKPRFIDFGTCDHRARDTQQHHADNGRGRFTFTRVEHVVRPISPTGLIMFI